MRIDLTKKEWDFLYYILPEIQRFQDIETSKFLKKLYEKLGSEWIDEEEEMRKFHEGFAYRPRKKE